MQSRSALKDQISKAWVRTIDGAYNDRLINSERGLQVYFCSALLDELKGAAGPRRIFVEPSLTIPGVSVPKYPDIVICNTKSVIGVVEIKYQPRTKPDYEKDVDTLTKIRQSRDGILLSNDRYRGVEENGTQYSIAKDAVFCWAGVYSAVEPNFDAHLPKEMDGRFLSLHAVTGSGRRPQIARIEF